ncbi:hypothetical protein EI94DRAFT_1750478, partial [Lactarius quietus]
MPVGTSSRRASLNNIWVMRSPAVLLGFFTAFCAEARHSHTEALQCFVFSPAYNFRSDLAADERDSKEMCSRRGSTAFRRDWSTLSFISQTASDFNWYLRTDRRGCAWHRLQSTTRSTARTIL